MDHQGGVVVASSNSQGQQQDGLQGQQQNGVVDEAERQKWAASIREQVGMAWEQSMIVENCPEFGRPLPTFQQPSIPAATIWLQLFSWHFNVFAWNELTREHPLTSLTLTLLEYFELLVSPGNPSPQLRGQASAGGNSTWG
jgi:hypothetical protein